MNRKIIYIVCVSGFTFEGTTFKVGDISEHCFGYNIPKHFKKATDQDIKKYVEKRRF